MLTKYILVNEILKHNNFVIILSLLSLSSRSELIVSTHPLILLEVDIVVSL